MSDKILQRFGEPILIPGVKEFTATKKIFQEEVNVGCFWPEGLSRFLDKIETNVDDAVIVGHELLKDSRDPPILNKLRRRYKETTFSQFYALLKAQSQRQEGLLLVDGQTNIFYVRDKNGKSRVLLASWSPCYGYWDVGFNLIGCGPPWRQGSRIFSRDSKAVKI